MKKLIAISLIGFISTTYAELKVVKTKHMPPALTLSVGDSMHLSNYMEKKLKKKKADRVVVKMVCNKSKKKRDPQYKCKPFEVNTPD